MSLDLITNIAQNWEYLDSPSKIVLHAYWYSKPEKIEDIMLHNIVRSLNNSYGKELERFGSLWTQLNTSELPQSDKDSYALPSSENTLSSDET